MSPFDHLDAGLGCKLGFAVVRLTRNSCEGEETVEGCERLDAVTELLVFSADLCEELFERDVAFRGEGLFVLVTFAEHLHYSGGMEAGDFLSSEWWSASWT